MASENLAESSPSDQALKDLPTKYLMLAAELKGKSPESFFHSKRVAAFSHRMGTLLGLTTVELFYLRVGAELHDIGKKDIPDDILHTESSLTNEQWRVMRTHSLKGAKMAELRQFDQRITDSIRYHHERFDGSGYPVGLAGTNIPLNARIVTLVDAYDTMTSQRVYQKRPRRIKDATLEIERCAGSQFDPQLTDIFLRYLRGRYQF